MSYATERTRAYAGQWGKGSQSTQKAFGAQNVGATPVKAGRFVALVDGGVQEITAATDAIAGVVVHTIDKLVYPAEYYLSVGSLPHGDSIWVELDAENADDPKLGDSVFIRVVGDNAHPTGTVLTAAITDKTATTDYKVINTLSNIVLIGRLG